MAKNKIKLGLLALALGLGNILMAEPPRPPDLKDCDAEIKQLGGLPEKTGDEESDRKQIHEFMLKVKAAAEKNGNKNCINKLHELKKNRR